MRVRLIKRGTIEDYVRNNAPSKSGFAFWLSAIKYADWSIANDIKLTYGSADLLGNGTNRVVFNLSGNKYRMICTYRFGSRDLRLFINWIGTHAEYTKLCDHNEQYTAGAY